METKQVSFESRRAFLRRIGQLATVGAATPLGINLAAIGEAAAFTATDYRALVCIFLFGGNDYANTVVNYDVPSWTKYRDVRAGLGIDRAQLAATALSPTVPLAGGREYALHPAMAGMAGLFNSGRAAVLLNVGPLIRPTTREEFFIPDRVQYPLPPQLMSHNDQQSVWQAQGAEGATVGWGGTIGDAAIGASSNLNALFTCISATGNAVFVAGEVAVPYQITRAGAVPLRAEREGLLRLPYADRTRQRIWEILTEPRTHVLESEYTRIVRRAMEAEVQISAAIRTVTMATAFPANNELAEQLDLVARLIAGRQALGNRRQVFIVSLGGFDLHDNLLENQPGLLRKVSDAVTAFYSATVELGVADKVTTFTASEFGRALTSNGNGTDHGWGGHHFVLGGAIRGQAYYGVPPPLGIGDSSSPEDQWHVGQGRLIPTTSVDQYAATLAKWFGVADSELAQILPNLKNFGAAAGFPQYPTDLGFLS